MLDIIFFGNLILLDNVTEHLACYIHANITHGDTNLLLPEFDILSMIIERLKVILLLFFSGGDA